MSEEESAMSTVREALKKRLVHSASMVYHRTVDRLERATSLRGLTKTRKKHAVIVDQSRIICEDYIFCRLQVDLPWLSFETCVSLIR